MSAESEDKKFREVLADLETLVREYPGLEPDLAPFLRSSPNLLARNYAYEVDQIIASICRALNWVREMERSSKQLELLRGGRVCGAIDAETSLECTKPADHSGDHHAQTETMGVAWPRWPLERS